MARFSTIRLCMILIAAFVATAFGPRSLAAPTTDSSAGKLVIVRALFGDIADDEKAVDVTKAVAAMVKDNSLSVIANKANFGAPPADEGGLRKLKVGYMLDGIYRSKTVAEGETLDISTRLVIRKAVYGKLPGGPTADVTEQVAEMVAHNRLSVEASNDNFGDPASNVVKALRVDYTLDGVDGSKTVAENQRITIEPPATQPATKPTESTPR